jgi:dihydropyrimidine dehydrogenase (NAD+) subunit PreT
LCQEACSRCGIDRPIELAKLQRYAIEQEEMFGMKILKAPDVKKPGKVACIGAGAASLAAAAKLAMAGYHVTIIERQERPGGVLSYAIASSRLPQEVVDYDIEHIKNLGVKFEFGKTVCKDWIASSQRQDGFDAIFIGTGLWGSQIPNIPGKDLKGVYTAVDFLKAVRMDEGNCAFGNKAVVIGGGDVAVDCAVGAKQLGIGDVGIVYRRTIEEAPVSMTELKHALELGVSITTNMSPIALEGSDKLQFIVFKGRDDKSELRIAADTVIFATGQKAEDITEIAPVELSDGGYIATTDGGRTSVEKIFAGGDITGGGRTVVEAVKAGKEAASSIISYLEGLEGGRN